RADKPLRERGHWSPVLARTGRAAALRTRLGSGLRSFVVVGGAAGDVRAAKLSAQGYGECVGACHVVDEGTAGGVAGKLPGAAAGGFGPADRASDGVYAGGVSGPGASDTAGQRAGQCSGLGAGPG